MKYTYGVFFLLFCSVSLMAQSPVKKTLAYSRGTISGVPGGASSQNPFPTSYFIYVIIKKGAAISVTGACLHGKWHHARLVKVDSPVSVDHDVSVPTGKKDVLVKKTIDDVYQVEMEEHQDPDQKN